MTEQDKKSLEELSKPFFRKINVGLITGVCAVLVSLMALMVSRAQMKAYAKTQKAAVMPIIDINMGYLRRGEHRWFEVTLNNVGAGIAHIQKVTPTIKSEPVTDYQAFEDAVMNRRMRGWSTLTEKTAAGYLRAGESITPLSYRFSGTNREIDAYLRGQFGTPFDGLDISVCFCSVFEDCWTVSYVDRKAPQPIDNCGITNNTPEDLFQTYIEQRAEVRAVKEDE